VPATRRRPSWGRTSTPSAELGIVDILVNNAAHQATFESIEDISDDEWQLTFKTNIHAMFYLTKAAVPHMRKEGVIIGHGQCRQA
jgi:NAD(P)-dependent dehydrogenase (short-subunit alcohol dehydrogenase family)